MGEQLFAQLDIPTANPYTFSSAFREAWELRAGYAYNPVDRNPRKISIGHEAEFAPERLFFEFVAEAPYHAPTVPPPYNGTTYHVDTLGYYSVSVPVRYGCRGELPGEVNCQLMLYLDGQPVFDGTGQQVGIDYHRITDNSETDGGDGYLMRTFTAILDKQLLLPSDTVEVFWQGDEWDTSPFGIPIGPTAPYWQIGPTANTNHVVLTPARHLLLAATFSVELLAQFPEGGLIRLRDCLPDITQLAFFKNIMLLLGLTIQADDYENHLHLTTGHKLLENIPYARNWSNKLDLFAPRGRQPERSQLLWKENEHVAAGYGNGEILVADSGGQLN